MQFFRALLLAAPLAGALRLDRRGKVDYGGYKVFRVASDSADVVEAELEDLEAIHLMRTAQHFDVAVPPESIDSFNALNVAAEVVTEDLGAQIATEGELVSYSSKSVVFHSTVVD